MKNPLDLRNMYSCPEADRAAYTGSGLVHASDCSLALASDVDAMADAIQKVLENIDELRGLDHKAIRNQKLGRADRES